MMFDFRVMLHVTLFGLDWQCNDQNDQNDQNDHGLKVAAKTLESFDEPDADLSHQCAEMVRTVIDSHDSRRLGNYCMERYGKHLVNPSGIFWWKN